MGDKKVQVVFRVKDDEFKKSLKETNDQIKLTKSQLQEAGSKLKTYGSNIQNLSEKHKLLKQQIENVSEKMKKYQDNIAKNTEKLNTNKQALEKLAQEKKKLKEQYNEAVKQYGKESQEATDLKAKLESLGQEYKEMENKVKSNTNALNSNMTNLNKTKAQYTELQGELSRTNKAIAENSNGFIKASKQFNEAGTKFKNLGGSFSSAGDNLMALTAPIVAVSAGAIKVGADFEEAMSQVRATCNPTQEEFESLRQKSIELGRDIKGASSKEVANSFNYLAMAGYSANEMLSAIEPNVKASIAMNIDMATSADLCTDAMSTMNLTADQTGHFLDVVAQTSRKANTNGQQMMEAYIGCGGMFRELNTPLQESATLLGTLANQGIKGSEAGTSLNSILINLMGNSGQAKEALASLNMSAYDSQGKFKGVTNVLYELKGKLSNCTEQQRQMFESFIGGKTQIDTLSALLNGLGDNYNSLYSDIGECDGAVEEMYQTMTDNTKGSWTEFKDELESVGIELADDLLPVCNDFLDIAKEFVEWFGNLDEGTRKMIVSTGLLTFATGGLLKGAGKLLKFGGDLNSGMSKILGWLGKTTSATKTAGVAMEGASTGAKALSGGFSVLGTTALPLIGTIGALAGAIYSYHEYQDAMSQSCLAAKENMSAMEIVMTELSGQTAYSKEELQEMGAEYKDFSENTSENAKQQMTDLSGKFRDLGESIKEITLKDAITDEDCSVISNKANTLCESIVNTINNYQSESYKAMHDLFAQDGAIDEAEQEILNELNKSKQDQINSIQEGKNKINEIYKKAKDEHRQLTQEEQDEVNRIIQEGEQKAIDNISMSDEEKAANIEAFYQRCRGLNQEGLSSMLEDERKSYDDSVQAIRDKYDKGIQAMQEAIPKLQGKAREEAEGRLKTYQEAEAKELQDQKDLYNGKLSIMEENYPKMLSKINIFNGEVLSRRDIACQKDLEKMQTHYSNLDQITESGNYVLWDSTANAWHNVQITVDDATGQITGMYDRYSGSIGGYSQDIVNSMQNTSTEQARTAQQIESALNDMSSTSISASGQIVGANNQVITSLNDFKRTGDNTREGILNLNGTPVRVQCDNNGAITNIDEVNDKLNEVKSKDGTTVTIWAKVKSFFEGVGDFLGFANGGTVGEGGVYNVNERGVELFDNLTQTAGYSLAALSSGYEKAYLSSGTKVTNAMMTTAKMKRMIENETDSKTSQVVGKLLDEFNKKQDSPKGLQNIKLETTNVIKLDKKVIAKETTEEVIKNIDRKAKNGGV